MAVSPGDATTIRPYHDDDVPSLVALFARVFGKRITAEQWRWKMQAHATRVPNVWLAMSGAEPVFQYAGIPQRYDLDGTQLDCLVSVDTMTHPDFRRRGLLTRVATEAYAAWRDGGAGFVIGLPNDQWGSRAVALGWIELFPLQWQTRPLRPEAVVARRARLPWLGRLGFLSRTFNAFYDSRLIRNSGVEVSEIETAGVEFDLLWLQLKNTRHFSAVRDRSWVDWRFLRSPTLRYRVLVARRQGRLLGYLAFRLIQNEGRTTAQLAELIAPPDEPAARDALFAELVALMKAAGAQLIATLAVPGTAHAKWLRHLGFFRGAQFSVQLVPLKADLPLEAMRDRHQWTLTGADFDVI
jgi:hypothetical protein